MSTVRIPYAMQDALSLLVMGPRKIGRGVGCVTTVTAKRLLEAGYAVETDGELVVTEAGRVAYDGAVRRSHADRERC